MIKNKIIHFYDIQNIIQFEFFDFEIEKRTDDFIEMKCKIFQKNNDKIFNINIDYLALLELINNLEKLINHHQNSIFFENLDHNIDLKFVRLDENHVNVLAIFDYDFYADDLIKINFIINNNQLLCFEDDLKEMLNILGFSIK